MKKKIIVLTGVLAIGILAIGVLQFGPATFAQTSQKVSSSVEDSKSRRQLAADLMVANNSIADLQNKLAKANSDRSDSQSELQKTKDNLVSVTAAKKTAEDNLTTANAELAPLKNATIRLVFYEGDQVDDKNPHFHLDLTLSDLLTGFSISSPGGHNWEGGVSGESDYDDGLCKVFTIHATK